MFRFYGFRIVKHVRSNYHSNIGKKVKGESHFTEEHQGSNFCDSFLCTIVSVGCRLLSQGPPPTPQFSDPHPLRAAKPKVDFYDRKWLGYWPRMSPRMASTLTISGPNLKQKMVGLLAPNEMSPRIASSLTIACPHVGGRE